MQSDVNLQGLLQRLATAWGKDPTAFVFRISMGVDLDRVKRLGSSRLGWSDLPWKEQVAFPEYRPYAHNKPLRHDQFIIASFWEDVWEDARSQAGTLAHKLRIYEDPFFTIYKRSGLIEVGQEKTQSVHNQGTHFEFIQDPIEVLDSVWCVKDLWNKNT